MEVVAGAVHPAETAKAMLHSEATATKNYVHGGHHKAALVGHRSWVAGLRGLSSAETGDGKYQELKMYVKNAIIHGKNTGRFSAGEVETVSTDEPRKGTR